MLESEPTSTTPGLKRGHSAYVVYVDESGDHNLESIDQEYPVFVLSFCVFRKGNYSHGSAYSSPERAIWMATRGL